MYKPYTAVSLLESAVSHFRVQHVKYKVLFSPQPFFTSALDSSNKVYEIRETGYFVASRFDWYHALMSLTTSPNILPSRSQILSRPKRKTNIPSPSPQDQSNAGSASSAYPVNRGEIQGVGGRSRGVYVEKSRHAGSEVSMEVLRESLEIRDRVSLSSPGSYEGA